MEEEANFERWLFSVALVKMLCDIGLIRSFELFPSRGVIEKGEFRMLCPWITVSFNFILINAIQKSLQLRRVGECLGMSVSKGLFLVLFFPLNFWMDESNDHNPIRWTLWSDLDPKQICTWLWVGFWESCIVNSIGYTRVTELPFQI